MTDDVRERLARIPIKNLDLGDVKLRRAIIRAGYCSIIEVLDLSEKEIEDKFDSDYDTAARIVEMQERYHDDPTAFADSVSDKEIANIDKTDRPVREYVSTGYKSANYPAAQRTARPYYGMGGSESLPVSSFSESLLAFERRAKDVFDELDDRCDDVMAYQAFGEFSTEFEDISDAFRALFRYYSNRLQDALNHIYESLSNIFIVYVADRARTVYGGGNLWGNFFNGTGISDDDVQWEFKQLFVKCVNRRRMPLYSKSEVQNWYFYTALLHGGLSGDAWSDLWQRSLLPLAKEIASGDDEFGDEMDGHVILEKIKDPNGKFSPKTTVLRILKKAPDSTIVPLLDNSMRVAEQIEKANNDPSEYTGLSTYGLPDAAMLALRDIAETTDSSESNRTGSDGKTKRKKFIYLPTADMHLDLGEGTVYLSWPKQQFPLHFKEYRIDYYIDGVLVHKEPFQVGVGKCLLDQVKIHVKLQLRYDVELKLMKISEDKAEEKGLIRQTFARSRPGCFEFIKGFKGIFRLRERNERIKKIRQIAYVAKPGLRIDPGPGMDPVSKYDADERHEGARIFIYNVSPGASGSLVDEKSGAEIAVWQERYSAKIDKRRILGETSDGMDLYGYVPYDGMNVGLPAISIEAMDGLTALEDLEIFCDYDGNEVTVQSRVLWRSEHGEAQIGLILQNPCFEQHIETCRIEARQKSAGGKVVFRYRFAVIPIQNFRLDRVSFEYGFAVAYYGFQPRLAIDVTDSQGEKKAVECWGWYCACVLLSDEFLHIRIETVECGKVTEAKLALAALDIDVPQCFMEISGKRPICLADVLKLNTSDGNCKIVATGRRHVRAAVAFLERVPVFYKELDRPGTYEFNITECANELVQPDYHAPSDKTFKLFIIYGDVISAGRSKPAWTDIDLLRFRQGFGIDGWNLLKKTDGICVMHFDGQPLCDLRLDFRKKSGGEIINHVDVPSDTKEVELPEWVARRLDMGKKLFVTVSPMSWFDDPEYEYASEFILER